MASLNLTSALRQSVLALEPTIRTMIAQYVFPVVAALLPIAASQTCWRDTVCTGSTIAAFAGPWDAFMLSPSSRTVSPVTIFDPDFTLLSRYPGKINLDANGTLVIYDFGIEVGGIITLNWESTGSGTLGLAFSETRNFTGFTSDGSDGTLHPGGDGALFTDITDTTAGTYTVPDISLRGGFRYLSIFALSNSAINVTITSVSLEISYAPAWSNLTAYGGYFFSNDALINRIWYSGAYTLQTNAVPPNTGRVFPLLDSGWANNAFLGTNGDSIFVDGSKRDRAPWSGDYAVALPSVFVSTGDFDSGRNSLQVQYDFQQSSGELPMAGPPLNFFGSDTYHLSTLLGTYEYVLHSGDSVFLSTNWNKIVLAYTFVSAKLDSTGLFDCTGTADWGRLSQGGHNTEANALMYGSLIKGAIMANWSSDPDMAATWTAQAATLKAAINSPAFNWDPAVGAFKNTDTDASIHPEDGNSLSLYYEMANASFVQSISTQLTSNWGPIGASCPELTDNVVPYVESMEVKGHLAARQATRALDLMRLSWGWYLNNPFGTESTLIEGYLTDGTFGYRSFPAGAGYGGDFSYTSHAHGWATGPTHALSTQVLGLQLTGVGGSTWVIAPQFGDLTSVEGGYTAGLGKFSTGWTLEGTKGYDLWFNVPIGTIGTLILPSSTTEPPTVTIDGTVTSGEYSAGTGLVTIQGQRGGAHNVTVTF